MTGSMSEFVLLVKRDSFCLYLIVDQSLMVYFFMTKSV